MANHRDEASHWSRPPALTRAPGQKSSPTRRVVHVAAVDFTLATFLRSQLRALMGLGYEVHTLSSPGPRLRSLREDGVECHCLPIPRRVRPLALLSSLGALTDFLRDHRFDIVHTHTPLASILARVAARRAKVPRVFYTAHGFYFHEGMNRSTYAAHVLLERWLGRYTDRVFVQSREDAATAVLERIVPQHRVHYIGNGVDPAEYCPEDFLSGRPGTRAALGFRNDDFVFVFTGRMVAEKGLTELLQAFESLASSSNRTKLLLVGGDVEGDRGGGLQQLRARVATAGLESRCRFAGLVDDVRPYLAVADAYVLPSHREGLPRSILEAMHFGLPVIATSIRGPREEVVHGETGFLVPPRLSGMLATAMQMLSADPPKARVMGQNGRKRALAEFTEELVNRRVLAGYIDDEVSSART
jgi:glycosyltransferase involved in cell wall biosynthesis